MNSQQPPQQSFSTPTVGGIQVKQGKCWLIGDWPDVGWLNKFIWFAKILGENNRKILEDLQRKKRQMIVKNQRQEKDENKKPIKRSKSKHNSSLAANRTNALSSGGPEGKDATNSSSGAGATTTTLSTGQTLTPKVGPIQLIIFYCFIEIFFRIMRHPRPSCSFQSHPSMETILFRCSRELGQNHEKEKNEERSGK